MLRLIKKTNKLVFLLAIALFCIPFLMVKYPLMGPWLLNFVFLIMTCFITDSVCVWWLCLSPEWSLINWSRLQFLLLLHISATTSGLTLLLFLFAMRICFNVNTLNKVSFLNICYVFSFSQEWDSTFTVGLTSKCSLNGNLAYLHQEIYDSLYYSVLSAGVYKAFHSLLHKQHI